MMDYERAVLRVAGFKPRTAREERKAAVSRAFRLADIAFRVAGLEEQTSSEETVAEDQIGRIVEEHSQYCVKSEKPGSDWSGGCYDTKGEAEDRLKQVERAKHAGSDQSIESDTAGITFKSAPEYKSIEDFVQYKMDDEDETFDHEDLQALNYRLKKPSKEIRTELESYGLSLKTREPEQKVRGFNTNDHDRWYGPGSDPTHGGSGGGSKWVPSVI